MPDAAQTPAATGNDEATQLRAALDAERRRADGLEAQVNGASRRLAQSEAGRLDAQGQALEGAIAALKSNISELEVEEADLQADGKFREAASVRTKISMAAARLASSEDAKVNLARHREEVARQPADPIEAFIAAGDFRDDEKAWIRRNTRYATDEAFRNRVNAAHAEAIGDKNYARGSREYYEYLDARGYQRADHQAGGGAARPADPAPAGTATAASADGGQVDSPFSDTGADGNPADPGIVIEEPADMPAAPEIIPAGARPENPQPRAAGTSAQTSMAAAPSRRSVSGARAAASATRRVLTPDEADFAFRLAQTLEPDVAAKGALASAAWYDEWKRSNRSQQIRAKWEQGA